MKAISVKIFFLYRSHSKNRSNQYLPICLHLIFVFKDFSETGVQLYIDRRQIIPESKTDIRKKIGILPRNGFYLNGIILKS